MDLASYISSYNVTYEEPKIEDHHPTIFASFDHVVVVVTFYILMVMVGPIIMRERKPFELKVVIMVYNVFQVLANSYIAYQTFSCWGLGMFRVWAHVCNPIGETVGFDEEVKFKFFQIMFFYYLTKILDLMDTVFFILRKKQSQVTVLHVFHHAWMVVCIWLSLAYLREQIGALFLLLNVIIHVLMYSYYFLSAFGPSMQKYLWWKKHLTKAQLVQFVIVISVLVEAKIFNCGCNPLYWWMWFPTICTFLILFLNFYITSYRSKRKMK